MSAPLITPQQIVAIGSRFPDTAVYVSQVKPFDKLPVPDGTIWVGEKYANAGIVLRGRVMRGLLDDAYELAVKLRDTLDEALAEVDEESLRWTATLNVRLMRNHADELANNIDRQCAALRGT